MRRNTMKELTDRNKELKRIRASLIENCIAIKQQNPSGYMYDKDFIQFQWAIDNNHFENFSAGAIAENITAKLGKLKRTNIKGADCSDGSEVKTGSVQIRQCKKHYGEVQVVISNVTHKTGKIRAHVYDYRTDKMLYFIFPPEVYRDCKHSICFNLITKTGKIGGGKYMDCQVKSLIDVCQ